MLLRVNNLRKNFGSNRVLSDVSFQAESGSALGLLGRNGAGKTTTIRIIMQVFPPDKGEILLDGIPLSHYTVSFGYLPEEKGLYPKQTIRNQLVYLARLRGLSMSQAKQAVQTWLDRLDLSQYLDKKLETLSKGNQQKIQLALALLHDPDIIILDEPFSGLDPVNALLLKDIVREQVQAGKIILFSSHQMNYVEQFCDQVAILHQGVIKATGSIRELKRGYTQNRLQVRFGKGSDR
ncbi:MAG: ATP-binding cassette domain-containing protein, partial [Bacillota bacterium]|nr:ATP-binding cassette domain-containing protein [Bacillota bacterium]